MKEVEEAIDRVMAGPERKTRVMNEREKRVIAYHEGGHALVAHILSEHRPGAQDQRDPARPRAWLHADAAQSRTSSS
mgnify:CR=1 FL=1